MREACDGAHCPDVLQSRCLQSLPGLRGRAAGGSRGTGSAAAGQGNKMAAHVRHVGLGHRSAQACDSLSRGERPPPLAMACRSEIEELKLRKGQKDTSRERKWTTSRAVRQGTGQDLLESGTGTGSKGQHWRGKNDARQRREIERVKILKKKGQERQKKGY